MDARHRSSAPASSPQRHRELPLSQRSRLLHLSTFYRGDIIHTLADTKSPPAASSACALAYLCIFTSTNMSPAAYSARAVVCHRTLISTESSPAAHSARALVCQSTFIRTKSPPAAPSARALVCP
jgi:hypothetical protein